MELHDDIDTPPVDESTKEQILGITVIESIVTKVIMGILDLLKFFQHSNKYYIFTKLSRLNGEKKLILFSVNYGTKKYS